MASYRLTFKKSVTKDFRLIPKDDVGRILKRIEALVHDPRPKGSEKLAGQRKDFGCDRVCIELCMKFKTRNS